MSEWGPWIEHDGRGIPPGVPGRYGQVSLANGEVFTDVLGQLHGPEDGMIVDCWNWNDPALRLFAWNERVIRYRIRKPRALEQLREIARNPERELEDA